MPTIEERIDKVLDQMEPTGNEDWLASHYIDLRANIEEQLRDMREDCAKVADNRCVCCREVWEEIARAIRALGDEEGE